MDLEEFLKAFPSSECAHKEGEMLDKFPEKLLRVHLHQADEHRIRRRCSRLLLHRRAEEVRQRVHRSTPARSPSRPLEPGARFEREPKVQVALLLNCRLVTGQSRGYAAHERTTSMSR